MSKIIGDGGFGCILSSFLCNGKISKNTKIVSKIQKVTNDVEELEIGKLIKRIKNYTFFCSDYKFL